MFWQVRTAENMYAATAVPREATSSFGAEGFAAQRQPETAGPAGLAVAVEAAFRVEDLACDPRGVRGAEPADYAGRVVRGAPGAGREQVSYGGEGFRVGPARVGRARVDAVDGDAAGHQQDAELLGQVLHSGLADRIRQLAGHRAQALATGEED